MKISQKVNNFLKKVNIKEILKAQVLNEPNFHLWVDEDGKIEIEEAGNIPGPGFIAVSIHSCRGLVESFWFDNFGDVSFIEDETDPRYGDYIDGEGGIFTIAEIVEDVIADGRCELDEKVILRTLRTDAEEHYREIEEDW